MIPEKGPIDIKIVDPSICFYCDTPDLNLEEKYCHHCGFPQRGEETEQRRFISQKRINAVSKKYNEKTVNNAKWYLYAIAAISLISGAIMGDSTAFLILGFFAAVFVGLAIWSVYNPFAALLTGLLIYLSLWLMDIIVDPTYIFKGIIIKLIIVIGLIKGIRDARNNERLSKDAA